MSLTKADERWLACLDRAIAIYGVPMAMSAVLDCTEMFYVNLPSVRADRGQTESK